MSADKLLTRNEAAKLLRLTPQTLAKWAMYNRNLPVIRLGLRAVRYRLSDVESFIRNSGGEVVTEAPVKKQKHRKTANNPKKQKTKALDTAQQLLQF